MTSRNLAEGVVALLADVGIRVVLQYLGPSDVSAFEEAGRWDWMIRDTRSELLTVVQSTTDLAPVGPATFSAHRAGPDGTVDLLPFEAELVALGPVEIHRELMTAAAA